MAKESEGNALEMKNLGWVSKEVGAVIDDSTCYGVEILHLFGLELLKEITQALDKSIFLTADVIIRPAKFYQYLVVWKVKGEESALERGRGRPDVSSPSDTGTLTRNG